MQLLWCSCVLETYRRSYKDVQLCLTFSSPDHSPTLVTVHHSQSPTADFRVLGVADIQKTSEACTHVIAFPEHKQQLLRFVRVQLRYCHGPRVHGVCKHEVTTVSLQGIPTIRRSVHSVNRRVRRCGIQVSSALRTPPVPGCRRKRSSLWATRGSPSPGNTRDRSGLAQCWGMAEADPVILRDGQSAADEHQLVVSNLTPRQESALDSNATPPACTATPAFRTPVSYLRPYETVTPKRPELSPQKGPPSAPLLPGALVCRNVPTLPADAICDTGTKVACEVTAVADVVKPCTPAPPPPPPPLPGRAHKTEPAPAPPVPPPPPPGVTKKVIGAPPPPPPPPLRKGPNVNARPAPIGQAAAQCADTGPAPTKKTVRLFWKKMADPVRAEQPTVWSDMASLPVCSPRAHVPNAMTA